MMSGLATHRVISLIFDPLSLVVELCSLIFLSCILFWYKKMYGLAREVLGAFRRKPCYVPALWALLNPTAVRQRLRHMP